MYVVRLYEGWQVWDAQIAEMTISASSINVKEKAYEEASDMARMS